MNCQEIKELEAGMKIPVIKQMDLSSFIKVKAKNPKMKIGVLGANIQSLTSYQKGDIVLYTPYTAEECYGRMLMAEIEHAVQHCTIEVPSDRYFKGESNISTIKTMVYVPLDYIEYEIVV